MTNHKLATRRRLLAPEVVQTSAMDCGPAALKCVLEGFGIPVSYGRLREACQTEVDGTSIDTLDTATTQLGLEAEQVMVPEDHLLLDETQSLPAIVVVRTPNGSTHFVVVWRRWCRFIQVMDPSRGRLWIGDKGLRAEIYKHSIAIPAQSWREWAGSPDFLTGLRVQMRDVGLTATVAEHLIDGSLADGDWRSLAKLDAATRMVEALVRSGGIKRGSQAAHVIKTFFTRAPGSSDLNRNPTEDRTTNPEEVIPAGYWMVSAASPGEDGAERVTMTGAVLMHVRGRRVKARADERGAATLSPELAGVLEEKQNRPGRELLKLLREDGIVAPLAVLAALALATGGVLIEALLFQGLFNFSRKLSLTEQRAATIATMAVFSLAILCLELPICSGFLRSGRRLEARLRLAFLEKIPRLSDRYFQSRLISDMADRSHNAQYLRMLPTLGGQFLRFTFELGLTAAGIVWLDPPGAWVAVSAALLAVALPLLIQSHLIERDLRVRSHNGALSRFYLDALLGLVAVRTHGAAQSLRREHEGLLVEWIRASLGMLQTALSIEAIEALAGFGLAAWLLFDHLSRGGDGGGALLLVYWALNLPVLGQEIAQIAQQYPAARNILLRAIEPLGAPEDEIPGDGAARRHGTQHVTNSSAPPLGSSSCLASATWGNKPVAGVSLSFESVSVRSGGHLILDEIDLEIRAGSHIAIVGSSGAGKSSLVGLLLGWYRAACGRVLVDGKELTGDALARLRAETAWVDPAIQLWNRSLIGNLSYGSAEKSPTPLGAVIEASGLVSLLEKLPDGLQSSLGEGGAMVSGGEGQRVRLGRAMMRDQARLVILDEPFRGLDRDRRRELMQRARQLWSNATLLCITHDVGETLTFERVLVVARGRVVEDGPPGALAGQTCSKYARMLKADDSVRKGLWGDSQWRRLRMDGGRITEEQTSEADVLAEESRRGAIVRQGDKAESLPRYAQRVAEAKEQDQLCESLQTSKTPGGMPLQLERYD